MKKRDQFPDHPNLLSGELYLFQSTDRSSSATGSLFGIVDKTSDGVIYLESSSRDLRRFRLWHRLPKHYRYHRRASRSELRDYIFNLACYECLEMQHGRCQPSRAMPLVR